MSSYAQEAQIYYNQGFQAGYNELYTEYMNGGPTGISSVSVPYTVPSEFDYAYLQGASAGFQQEGLAWSI